MARRTELTSPAKGENEWDLGRKAWRWTAPDRTAAQTALPLRGGRVKAVAPSTMTGCRPTTEEQKTSVRLLDQVVDGRNARRSHQRSNLLQGSSSVMKPSRASWDDLRVLLAVHRGRCFFAAAERGARAGESCQPTAPNQASPTLVRSSSLMASPSGTPLAAPNESTIRPTGTPASSTV